jgi:hypothetical protein
MTDDAWHAHALARAGAALQGSLPRLHTVLQRGLITEDAQHVGVPKVRILYNKNIIRSHVHAQNVSTDQLIQLGQQLIQLDVLLLAMYM